MVNGTFTSFGTDKRVFVSTSPVVSITLNRNYGASETYTVTTNTSRAPVGVWIEYQQPLCTWCNNTGSYEVFAQERMKGEQ